MKIKNDEIVFSPSDLARFSVSPFASWMERLVLAEPELKDLCDGEDKLMALLAKKGDEHEHAVLHKMEAEGKTVARIDLAKDQKKATIEAMEQGVEVIFQAAIAKPPFAGYADFLIKVPGKSALGDYHYEVWDTKLAREVKPYFVIQLCCYIDMLAEIQQKKAQQFVVVHGNNKESRLNTEEYFYYYLNLKHAFLAQQDSFTPAQQPDPFGSNEWGRWSNYANELLEQQDHLCRVATVTRSQIKKLKAQNITSMTALAQSKCDSIHGLQQDAFLRLKQQAQIQIRSQGLEKPLFELIKYSEPSDKGLTLLPSHSTMDVYFDIEGYPLDEGGLEYLWGNSYFEKDNKGSPKALLFDGYGYRLFKDFWAHDQAQEKQAFKDFITWAYARWQQQPDMHIYHYANYEIAACRKLMGRYGVCEFEVDELLRNDVFVDLYKVVKGAFIIGEPRYSIKNVELLYRGKRETEVGNGGDSVVVYENWRQAPDGDTWQSSKILNGIRDYNIDDCDSTQELVFWLRDQQVKYNVAYREKVKGEEKELTEQQQQDKEKSEKEEHAKKELRDRLLTKAEDIREQDKQKNKQQADLIENLAWSLDFHKRENKPVFWRLFDRLGMTDMELIDDADCLAICQRTSREAFKPTVKAINLAYEYRFDKTQEFKSINCDSFYVLGLEDDQGKNVSVKYLSEYSDLDKGLIVIQTKNEPHSAITLIPYEIIPTKTITSALNRVVASLEDHVGSTMPRCAIVDFLNRAKPNIKGLNVGDTIVSSQNPEARLQQIINAVINLDNSYLAIQGPPGAGKTYTAKHVIAELLKRGKKIGICSNSNKAINNLLIGTVAYCREHGIEGQFMSTKETDPALNKLGVKVTEDKSEIETHSSGPCVIGTTAWGFARKDLAKRFDYLFIDEAGQVSVANLIAISQSCDNIVLMGDQMQLAQPSQGTHPKESGLSTLDYLLHESPTIDQSMGVFLDTTYRMHSKVNEFISNSIYNGKLIPDTDNNKQIIEIPDNYQGELDQQAGIHYIEVDHEGNTQASREEVDKIAELSQSLLGRIFTDKEGNTRKIAWQDMLFVAPYNHQVAYLKSKLGEQARVGSVDKFQGQEAPIVFLSMCASNAAESPRGIAFLFDKHRINVAISRAQSLAIVVASSNLINSTATNTTQQRQVNLMARLKQHCLTNNEILQDADFLK